MCLVLRKLLDVQAGKMICFIVLCYRKARLLLSVPPFIRSIAPSGIVVVTGQGLSVLTIEGLPAVRRFKVWVFCSRSLFTEPLPNRQYFNCQIIFMDGFFFVFCDD